MDAGLFWLCWHKQQCGVYTDEIDYLAGDPARELMVGASRSD